MSETWDMQSDPFQQVTVDRLISGGTQVQWSMRTGFDAPTPWSFQLQWAQRGEDSAWNDVTTVTDTFMAVDSSKRQRGMLPNVQYRVVLTDGEGHQHRSRPTGYPDQWNSTQLRVAREVRRRSHRQMSITDDRCWILFRRRWGPTCSVCASPTTGEVRDPQCSTCYGTGIEGGYFDPYPADCMITGHDGRIVRHMGTTIYENMALMVSIIPRVREGDAVIMDGSDARLVVKEVKPIVQMSGKAIVQGINMTAVSPKDVLYDIQWNGSDDPADGEVEL